MRRRHRVPEISVLAWVAQISRCELSWKIAGKPHAKLLFKSGALFSKRALLVRWMEISWSIRLFTLLLEQV